MVFEKSQHLSCEMYTPDDVAAIFVFIIIVKFIFNLLFDSF